MSIEYLIYKDIRSKPTEITANEFKSNPEIDKINRLFDSNDHLLESNQELDRNSNHPNLSQI